MDNIQKLNKSSGEKTQTQRQCMPVVKTTVGKLVVENNVATESSTQNSNPASSGADISQDPLVQYLMSSAIVGWQLYAMARAMFDDLSMYSSEQKTAHFQEVATKSITDVQGNMVPFRPIETVAGLQSVVLPFWRTKIEAEREIARKEKERNDQKDKTADTSEVKG